MNDGKVAQETENTAVNGVVRPVKFSKVLKLVKDAMIAQDNATAVGRPWKSAPSAEVITSQIIDLFTTQRDEKYIKIREFVEQAYLTPYDVDDPASTVEQLDEIARQIVEEI